MFEKMINRIMFRVNGTILVLNFLDSLFNLLPREIIHSLLATPIFFQTLRLLKRLKGAKPLIAKTITSVLLETIL